MKDTNKVIQMIEKRAQKKGEIEKKNFYNHVLSNIEGHDYHQICSSICKHIKSDSIKYKEVMDVLNAMFEACYERAYEQAYQTEIDNISQILSFMERELNN